MTEEAARALWAEIRSTPIEASLRELQDQAQPDRHTEGGTP